MSMFVCARCDSIRDSDDGCEEAPASKYHPPHQLLCAECVEEAEDALAPAADLRADRAAEERGIDEQRAWYDTSEELK